MNMTQSRVAFRCLIALFALLCFSTLSGKQTFAQDVDHRTFPISVGEAKAAVQKIGPFTRGRLPALEGFVQPSDQPIDHYDKGYFECTFQITSISSASTMVKAIAKVTAWYSDPDVSRSGYRVLVSNGRLESDALDRLAQVLTQTGAGTSRTMPSGSPAASNSSVSAPGATHSSILPPAPTTNSGDAIDRAASSFHVSSPSLNLRPSPPVASSTPAMSPADQKKAQGLSDYIKNLEEIQRNQSRPNDLVAVKKAKTPVYDKPSDVAQVVMRAEAEDEFPVLGLDGPWVHVQISGVSRGWIQRSQLEMPLGVVGASTPTETFKVTKEETTPFHGNWAPLKGKPVRVEWVEPANAATSTSRKEKLAFAKSVFLRVSVDQPSSGEPAAGIVVVFDSADGGQIAALMASVKALANRTLSDTAFWHQCSVDPPESFLDRSTP